MSRSFQYRTMMLLAVVILFRLVIQFALYKAGFISITADEFGRTVVAANWSKHPALYWHGAWLPFHCYFIGVLLLVKWELLWIPRLITILLSLVSIVFTYSLALKLFKSQSIGLLSAFLLSVNPAHIWLSGVPLTEVPSTMFVLIGAWAFASYLEDARYNYLLISGTMFALANGFRYEAWFVSILFTSAVAYEIGNVLKNRKILGGRELLMIAAACMPWLFPLAWIAGNYVEKGNPLAFFLEITNYKRQWYGQTTSYYRYLETFLKTDPFLTCLGLMGIFAYWQSKERVRIKLWYIAITVIPLCIFIILHRGQVEPAGNYIRYLAPFSFLFYPALGYLGFISVQVVKTEKLKICLLGGLLALIVVIQVSSAFHFTNDPAASGLAVGQAIRELRQRFPAISDRPVMIELSYWQYLAIHVGANDMDRIMYDRVLDIQSRNTQSLLLADYRAFESCLLFHNVSYLVVKDPILKAEAESKLGLQSTMQVNGYAFYPVESLSSELSTESVTCPLPFGHGY